MFSHENAPPAVVDSWAAPVSVRRLHTALREHVHARMSRTLFFYPSRLCYSFMRKKGDDSAGADSNPKVTPINTAADIPDDGTYETYEAW